MPESNPPTPSPTPEPFDFEAWKAERVLKDCSDPTCIEFGLRGHLHWVLPEIGDKRNV